MIGTSWQNGRKVACQAASPDSSQMNPCGGSASESPKSAAGSRFAALSRSRKIGPAKAMKIDSAFAAWRKKLSSHTVRARRRPSFSATARSTASNIRMFGRMARAIVVNEARPNTSPPNAANHSCRTRSQTKPATPITSDTTTPGTNTRTVLSPPGIGSVKRLTKIDMPILRLRRRRTPSPPPWRAGRAERRSRRRWACRPGRRG